MGPSVTVTVRPVPRESEMVRSVGPPSTGSVRASVERASDTKSSTGARLQAGYQLFLTLRAGYHVELFQRRTFLEPSIAVTAWPINTNLPASFREREERWPRYFIGEPGLHFGVNF